MKHVVATEFTESVLRNYDRVFPEPRTFTIRCEQQFFGDRATSGEAYGPGIVEVFRADTEDEVQAILESWVQRYAAEYSCQVRRTAKRAWLVIERCTYELEP
jgi:hypothetical protein